jgi:predicted dehydrogenase
LIRVAILGCGKVADKHADAILRLPGVELVATCDREELMARQMAERYRIPRTFGDLGEMLAACQPTVVHITTPPQIHFALARQCLEAGSHVYVEKPFTVSGEEAKALIQLAEAKGLKVTAGHNTQFTPAAREMRRLIQEGYLGGSPVHMESIYCYDFTDERFAKALLGDSTHWVRSLPGKLLHNIISHGIGKIVEFLPGTSPHVLTHGFTSAFLERIGENKIVDELRVIIHDECRTTAFFTFSSQISPTLHQFRVYGPRNSLLLDHHHQTLIRVPKRSYKSFLDQFLPPLLDGKQHMANGWRNLRQFLKRDFHSESGLNFLVAAFYESIVNNTPPPIPYRDIVLTAQIMDEIFLRLPP